MPRAALAVHSRVRVVSWPTPRVLLLLPQLEFVVDGDRAAQPHELGLEVWDMHWRNGAEVAGKAPHAVGVWCGSAPACSQPCTGQGRVARSPGAAWAMYGCLLPATACTHLDMRLCLAPPHQPPRTHPPTRPPQSYTLPTNPPNRLPADFKGRASVPFAEVRDGRHWRNTLDLQGVARVRLLWWLAVDAAREAVGPALPACLPAALD